MSEVLKSFKYNDKNIEIKIIFKKSNSLEPIIFLHEGLGSISLWKDFPSKVSLFLKRDVIVYSRFGMGNSSPIANDRDINYMHVEAIEVLPELLKYLNISNPILYGHSDGASIALIYAGSGYKCKSLILEAPHVFVEDISVRGANEAKKMWNNNVFKDKLSKHHKDVNGAFNGWCNAWTSKKFRSWNIENYLKKIDIPTMLIQGKDDQYGTMKQLDSISDNIKNRVYRLEIEKCGHNPHVEHSELVLKNVKNFLKY